MSGPGAAFLPVSLQTIEKVIQSGKNRCRILPGRFPFGNDINVPAIITQRLPAPKELPCLALNSVANHGIANLPGYRYSQPRTRFCVAGGNQEKIAVMKFSSPGGEP